MAGTNDAPVSLCRPRDIKGLVLTEALRTALAAHFSGKANEEAT
jgi:hypothetical protein